MVLHRPVEMAAQTGKVGPATLVVQPESRGSVSNPAERPLSSRMVASAQEKRSNKKGNEKRSLHFRRMQLGNYRRGIKKDRIVCVIHSRGQLRHFFMSNESFFPAFSPTFSCTVMHKYPQI
jgi:hypothetical protein